MRQGGEALLRWCRLYRQDGNPLRRGVDRAEGVVAAVLLLLGLMAVPVSLALGTAVYERGVRAERSGHWVTAHLLADVPEVAWVSEGTTAMARTQVTWQEPGTGAVTGYAPVTQGAKAGEPVRLWVDASGEPTARPPDRAETVAQAIGGAFFALLGSVGLLMLVFILVRCGLDRHRDRLWDDAWLVADRRWSRPEQPW
jgi:hypothetical protein